MPLNLTMPAGADFSGALLPPLETLDDLYGGIAGIRGIWEAQDYTASPWPAKYGAGSMTLASPTAPVQSDSRPLPTLEFASTSTFAVTGGVTSGQSITIGLRAYLDTTAQTAQYLLGGASGYSLWRRTSDNMLVMTTGGGSNTMGALANGLHTFIVMQSADTVRVEVDGTILGSFAQAGAPITALAIGNRMVTQFTSGLMGGFRRCAVADANLHGTDDLAIFRDALNRV